MKVKGGGTVRAVKDKHGKPVKNSWQLVLSLGYDPLTGKRRQKCRSFRGTKTEARKALEQFRREVESGLKIDADKVTFGEYSQLWLDIRIASKRFAPATLARNRQILAHLNRHIGFVPLRDIDSTTITNLYIALANEDMGQSTMAKLAVTLKQILRQAVSDKVMLSNPCDGVMAPKQKKPKAGNALDRNGVARLVACLDEELAREYPHAAMPEQKHASDMAHVVAVLLALGAGLRRGEVLGLSWEDVDFDAREIHVRYSLCKTTGELKEPKTENGDREVSLGNQLIDTLRQWHATQGKYLLSLGIASSGKTPVITSEAGSRMDGNNLSRWWRKFCEKYGFENLRFHDLRHTHATMLVSSGLNIKAVSARIGHASVGLTLDLYSHAQREDDQKAAVITEEYMTRPARPSGLFASMQPGQFQHDCDSSVIVLEKCSA